MRKLKKTLGILCISSPFVALFVGVVIWHGLLAACIGFSIIGFIVALMGIGLHLLED
jgi:uncharacterized membrane protein required for colicin V production